ncbi:MAG: adenylosuccinate lyase [Elusimicrobia bacterium]|nr:adenylosuccinate lyase [Elusimicrobiota bacterium]
MERLFLINPVDGRYSKQTEPLKDYFSEAALIKYRIIVECEYFLYLALQKTVKTQKLKSSDIEFIKGLENPSSNDIAKVKEIETEGTYDAPATNHDVKAVEYYLKAKFAEGGLSNLSEYLHLALTSEDTNNISYAMMLSSALKKIILPKLENIQKHLLKFSNDYAGSVLLARTHGQPAVPTTFGKEFRVYENRIRTQISRINQVKILSKLNGAAGNYNAHVAAFPKINWLKFSENFIKRLNDKFDLNIAVNKITTQIEPHDSYCELFDALRAVNIVLTDMCQDIWRYISDDLLIQKAQKGEIGSSTMPHKINPISFENAEGNLGMANALFQHFSSKLPISRLQRDLSDSTVERNFGVAFAHSLIAYNSVVKGLSRIKVSPAKAAQQIAEHPEIYAEAIQTILRRENFPKPYELLKTLTRGSKINHSKLNRFIKNLKISKKTKKEILDSINTGYIGIANKIAKILE